MHSPQETQDEFPIGQIVIEGDAGLISLAAPRQHPVVANLIAAANAAVAQDAGFVIDGDGQGRIVVPARRGALAEIAAAQCPALRRQVSSSQSPECC